MNNHIVVLQRTTFTRIFAGGLIFLLIISSPFWEEESVTGGLLFLLGAILVGMATVGRLWCSLYIAGYKTNTLITAGPYSVCRNPLYFFSLLGAVGAGFATETLVVPAIIFAGFILFYPLVIKGEETELMEIHKERYRDYFTKTPRFFPDFSLFYEPETYKVNPRIFRKNVFDALWFVWILGILELMEALHESGIIPSLLKLY